MWQRSISCEVADIPVRLIFKQAEIFFDFPTAFDTSFHFTFSYPLSLRSENLLGLKIVSQGEPSIVL